MLYRQSERVGAWRGGCSSPISVGVLGFGVCAHLRSPTGRPARPNMRAGAGRAGTSFVWDWAARGAAAATALLFIVSP